MLRPGGRFAISDIVLVPATRARADRDHGLVDRLHRRCPDPGRLHRRHDAPPASTTSTSSPPPSSAAPSSKVSPPASTRASYPARSRRRRHDRRARRRHPQRLHPRHQARATAIRATTTRRPPCPSSASTSPPCAATPVSAAPTSTRRLVAFTADLDHLADAGADIARHNLANDPPAFADDETVRAFLQVAGSEGLPADHRRRGHRHDRQLPDARAAAAVRRPRAEEQRWCPRASPHSDSPAPPMPTADGCGCGRPAAAEPSSTACDSSTTRPGSCSSPARAASARPPWPAPPPCSWPSRAAGCCWSAPTRPPTSARSSASRSATPSPPIPDVPGLSRSGDRPEQAADAYRERIIGPVRGLLPDAEIASITEQLSGSCTTEVASFNEFTALLADPDVDRRLRPRPLRHRPHRAHHPAAAAARRRGPTSSTAGKGDASCLGPAGRPGQAARDLRRRRRRPGGPRPHPAGPGRPRPALRRWPRSTAPTPSWPDRHPRHPRRRQRRPARATPATTTSPPPCAPARTPRSPRMPAGAGRAAPRHRSSSSRPTWSACRALRSLLGRRRRRCRPPTPRDRAALRPRLRWARWSTRSSRTATGWSCAWARAASARPPSPQRSPSRWPTAATRCTSPPPTRPRTSSETLHGERRAACGSPASTRARPITGVPRPGHGHQGQEPRRRRPRHPRRGPAVAVHRGGRRLPAVLAGRARVPPRVRRHRHRTDRAHPAAPGRRRLLPPRRRPADGRRDVASPPR